MASLADELLADLGSDSGDEFAQDEQATESGPSYANGHGHNAQSRGRVGASEEDGDDDDEAMEDLNGASDSGASGFGGQGGSAPLNRNAVRPAEEMDEEEVERMQLGGVGSVREVSKLLESNKMRETMKAIDHYAALPEPDIEGVLEESPEYQLIVKANNLAVDVDNEILIVHKYIRDHYSPRFPELETLILNPWEFVQAVQALGNETDMTKAKLDGILPHGTVVVISMTASTTSGRPLEERRWANVKEACEMVFEMESARRKILAYVESRMTFISPNLSAVVGTRVATKLLGVAGGLTGLSKIPSCNVHLLGASHRSAPGLATSRSARLHGFIYQSDLVQNVGEEYHRQALRMVGAKALLAGRMDLAGSDRAGSYGQRLHEELVKKLEKLQEPPPSKMTKALPVPKEGGKRQRRGGRRARKAKEAMGMTELRKLQNRVEFGKAEEEAGAFDETVGMGMVSSGGSGSGRVRAALAEAKGKAKMSKANKGRLAALQAQSGAARLGGAGAGMGGSESSGTASSLSFTPVQGIELVDPSRAKKVQEANAKWFQEGQFSLLPGVRTAGSASAGSMGPPALPRK